MPVLMASSLSRALRQVAPANDYSVVVEELPGGGPLAYWRRLNTSSTINDFIGSRHATVTGTASSTEGLPLNSDDAIVFGGAASASVPHDAGLALATLSLSFWVKMADVIMTGAVLSKRGATLANGDLQVTQRDDRSLRVRFTDATLTHHYLDTEADLVGEGQVMHLCIRADGTGFELFLNGESKGKTTTYTAAWTPNVSSLLFAISPVDPAIAVTLDEIALYPRVLTVTEIATLAQRIDPPVADNDTYTVNESLATVLAVTGNDSYIGSKASLLVEALTQPSPDSVAVDANNDIVYTAGAVASDTARSFTYRITDANGVSNTATVSVTVKNAVAPASDFPFFGQYYGGGWPSHSNGEYRLQGTAHHFFFYAERTGTVVGFQWAWRSLNPGTTYSQGDGGRYTIEIVEADPATKRAAAGGSVRCSVSNIQPGNPSGSTQRFLEYNFSTTGTLTTRQPYVFRVTNTHATPSTDYVSQNVVRWYVFYASDGSNFTEPGGGGGTGGIVVASGGIRGNVVGASIARVRGFAPHMIEDAGGDFLLYPVPIGSEGTDLLYRRMGGVHAALRYSDGTYTGWGRGSGEFPGVHPTGHEFIITGSNQIRQRFRVSRGNRVVSGVFVMAWSDGTTGDVLVRLEQGPQSDSHTAGNGTLMGSQITVPANMFLNAGPTLAHNQVLGGAGSLASPLELVHYVWVPFGENHTLTQGQIYNLRLVPSGCDLHMVGGARGDDKYGPDGRTIATWDAWENQRQVSWSCWEDSRGPQISTNGGTSWSYGPGSAQQIPITFKCV